MLTIYLMRHGQKQKTRPDPELTELGHEQAKKTAKYFTKKSISRIKASPMVRTQQTASHIAEALGLTIETDQRLRERMDYQNYTEESLDDFVQEWIKATEKRNFVPRWGDSSLATGNRLQQVTEEFDAEKNQEVVLVTHGGAIADFLKNIFDNRVLEEQMADILIGKDFDIKECSITIVTKDQLGYHLVSSHSTSHLE